MACVINRRSLIVGGLAGVSALCLPALAQGRQALTIARFAPGQIGLHWRVDPTGAYGTLAQLHQGLTAPQALMNAGIYEMGAQGFQPQGLHIEAGREQRPLNTKSAANANFYMKPNGVFYIDAGGARIVRTPDYAPAGPVRLATQSGPLLFDARGVHPRFIEGSTSRKRRNAVGIDGAGQVVFALADGPINFWDFAHGLMDQGCTAALYMDGAISQMWLRGKGAPNDWQQFAGILSAS